MDKYNVVSSFGPSGVQSYVPKFLESWNTKLSKDSKGTFYYHDLDDPTVSSLPGVRNSMLRNLRNLRPFEDFRTNYKWADGTNGGKSEYNFRLDATKFSAKVFAIGDAMDKLIEASPKLDTPQWLIWIDADTFATRPITTTELERWLPDDKSIVYLSRTAASYAETSFIGFNIAHQIAIDFINDLRGLYTSGELFHYREWHDGFVFERLIRLYQAHGLNTHSLSEGCPDLNAFAFSDLGNYMTHLKGPVAKAAFTANQGAPTPSQMPTPQAPPSMLRVHGVGGEGSVQPIVVSPKDAVEEDYLYNNIVTNQAKFKEYIGKFKRHSKTAVVVGSGPSLAANMRKLKKLAKNPKYEIFAVKHAMPALVKAGVVPKYCVVLDARPIAENSTHGVKRADLYDTVPKETTFLVASMTDPATVDHLMTTGARVVGWDAFSGLAFKKPELQNRTLIAGGTCAATRAVGIAHTFGFRNFILVGIDAAYEFPKGKEPSMAEKDRNGLPKWMQIDVGPEFQKHWTTGELIALVQDMQQLWTSPHDFEFDVWCGGLVGDLWKKLAPPKLPEYEGDPLDKSPK